MTTQTLFVCSPDDLEAIMQRALAPFVERIRELELAAGSTKHLYTVKEAGQRMSYSPDLIRQFIREGKCNVKGRRIYLKATEITNGDLRIRPCHIDEFVNHFPTSPVKS